MYVVFLILFCVKAVVGAINVTENEIFLQGVEQELLILSREITELEKHIEMAANGSIKLPEGFRSVFCNSA